MDRLLIFFGSMMAAYVLYYLWRFYKQKHLIKTDSRYQYYNTPEDTLLLDCKDCRCTKHYLIIKTGKKAVLCYEDLLWVCPYHHNFIASKEAGRMIKAFSKNGTEYKVMYGANEDYRDFEIFLEIIKEKNPDCIIGNSEEDIRQYKQKVKYHK
ncbi:hypothetical protein [Beduini massiliensis]|uniref:hypothetical protein n=1 Tax=Beduini massiliensis TaxID=1585974 RepID=UPI00059A7A1F|nr:hypothetical protein [Beduini massiliensis]